MLNNRQISPNRNCSTLAIPWCFYKMSRAFDGISTSIIWQKYHPPELKHRPIFPLLPKYRNQFGRAPASRLLFCRQIKMLCRPIHSSHVCQAWMQASPRRGCVSQGYPLAMMNGCSSLCRRRQLQSRLTWVSLTLYLTVSFTNRCCASARTLVLLFLGTILQHHLYPTSLQK